MALPAQDSFTAGSDYTTLESYSANWTTNAGAFEVPAANDAANPFAAGVYDYFAHWNADAFNNDQYAQVTITAVYAAAYAGPAVRVAAGTGSAGYELVSDASDGLYLGVVDSGGTWAALGSKGTVWSVNDVGRLEASGTTITPKRNGSTDGIGAQTDSTVASGYAGIAGGASGATRMDNFEGGNLGGGGTEQNPAGVANGAGTATAVLRVSKRPAGVASGAGTAQAALSITGVLAAVANGTSTATGSLQVSKRPAAVANGTGTATCALTVATAAVELAGVAIGVGTASAALTLDGWEIQRSTDGASWADLVHLPPGTSSYTDPGPFEDGVTYYYRARLTVGGVVGDWSSADSLLWGMPPASANGTSTATAALAVTRYLAGVANGAGTSTATVAVTRTPASTANGTSTATAALTASKRSAGVSNGTASATAALAATRFLAGTANGSSSATAALTTEAMQNPAGAANGTSTASAALLVSKRLAGVAAGASTATVAARATKQLAGTANGTATATAALTSEQQQNPAGVAAGTSTAAGTLTVSKRLAAVAAGTSSATVAVSNAQEQNPAGIANGTSAVAVVVSISKYLAARADGAGGSTGALAPITRYPAGVANGVGSATCVLEVGITRYQIGEQASPMASMREGKQFMVPAGSKGRVREVA